MTCVKSSETILCVMAVTSDVKGDFNRHESLDGWEVVVRLKSKQNSANQRPPYRHHLTNKRPAGNSIKVSDTWILRERKSPGKKVENGLQITPRLSPPPSNTLKGKSGAGETRNHKRIMEMVIEH